MKANSVTKCINSASDELCCVQVIKRIMRSLLKVRHFYLFLLHFTFILIMTNINKYHLRSNCFKMLTVCYEVYFPVILKKKIGKCSKSIRIIAKPAIIQK